jgi:hypothetical protein
VIFVFILWYHKVQKHLPNCLKIAETNIVLIVFNGVICDVGAYPVTVSFCRTTWIRYRKCFIRSMTSYFDHLYSYSKSRWQDKKRTIFVSAIFRQFGRCFWTLWYHRINTNTLYIVVKYKINLLSLRNRLERLAFLPVQQFFVTCNKGIYLAYICIFFYHYYLHVKI